jgi:hypothetical protein
MVKEINIHAWMIPGLDAIAMAVEECPFGAAVRAGYDSHNPTHGAAPTAASEIPTQGTLSRRQSTCQRATRPLLRGINVGGNNKLPMEDLVGAFA